MKIAVNHTDTIVIPLSRFLSNGGILEKGRLILSNGDSGDFVEFQNDDTNRPILSKGKEVLAFFLDMCFIEIPCTPIYK